MLREKELRRVNGLERVKSHRFFLYESHARSHLVILELARSLACLRLETRVRDVFGDRLRGQYLCRLEFKD